MAAQMNSSRDRILFWGLIALQAVGSQTLMWVGLPVYRRLRSAVYQGVSLQECTLAIAVVVLMQVCYWTCHRLKRQLRFRPHPLLGQILVCIADLSLLFTAGLASLIAFDRFAELEFSLWRLLLLVAILFATTSYKHQLTSLGNALINAESDPAPPSNPATGGISNALH